MCIYRKVKRAAKKAATEPAAGMVMAEAVSELVEVEKELDVLVTLAPET